MHLSRFLLSSLLAACVQGQALCGSSEPPEEAIDAARLLQHSKSLPGGHVSPRAPGRTNETLVIPTYVHIVESEADVGFVTQKMLDDQV
jgi:hypothetical protein